MFPPRRAFDLHALAETLPRAGKSCLATMPRLALCHAHGATAEVVPGRSPRPSRPRACRRHGGTGNEQAAGLGLPLVAVAGAGNQGPAYLAMKKRYFGAAATTAASDPRAIADALTALAADPACRAEMAQAGRALMGRRGRRCHRRRRPDLAGWEGANG